VVSVLCAAVARVAARDLGRRQPVAVEVGPCGHEHARRVVEEAALERGGARVAVHDVELESAQEHGHLPVEAADGAVHDGAERLVLAALLVRIIQIDAQPVLARARLLLGVGVEGGGVALSEREERHLAIRVRPGDVVELVSFLALKAVTGQRVRGAARVAVGAALARHHVARARDRVARAVVEAGHEVAHGRVAVLLAAADTCRDTSLR